MENRKITVEEDIILVDNQRPEYDKESRLRKFLFIKYNLNGINIDSQDLRGVNLAFTDIRNCSIENTIICTKPSTIEPTFFQMIANIFNSQAEIDPTTQLPTREDTIFTGALIDLYILEKLDLWHMSRTWIEVDNPAYYQLISHLTFSHFILENFLCKDISLSIVNTMITISQNADHSLAKKHIRRTNDYVNNELNCIKMITANKKICNDATREIEITLDSKESYFDKWKKIRKIAVDNKSCTNKFFASIIDIKARDIKLLEYSKSECQKSNCY